MFEQVKLPYGFADLEPHIDTLTMETHYQKHHATYTKNFNDLVEKVPSLAGKSCEDILSNLEDIPAEFRTGIRNNGGGYYNHNIYFEQLSPKGGLEPTGELAEQIKKEFGSFATLKEKMSAAGMGQFGSGWAWLIKDDDGNLKITSSANQDSPLNDGIKGLLLTLDVWEHAYYLKYKNLRAEYIKAFWNVVNWEVVLARYNKK